MSSTKEAPATFSRSSRKGKKAWRKNVDVTEIQAGLEEAREEVVQGGIIAEKPSEELFVIDTAGSEQIKKKHIKQAKPLRADEIIAARASAVPALDSRKRKSIEIPPADKSKRSKKNTYISEAEVARLKSAADATTTIVPTEAADHDPWAVVENVQDPRFSFLEEKVAVHEPNTLKHAPVSLAKSGKAFAAVRRPEDGKSYNPDFEAWQASIAKAGGAEVEAERKRRATAAAEAEALEKLLAEAARVEVEESEYESAWESEWEGLRSENEADGYAKKKPERKTPAERNRIKRRKKLEAESRHATKTKSREERHQLAKDNGPGEQAVKVLRPDESDVESGDEEVLRRRPLGGKINLLEKDLELVLADELKDSLRALKPEGNLLKDRYRNLLVNGKIEARRNNVQHKKPRREVTEKWTYKDFKVPGTPSV